MTPEAQRIAIAEACGWFDIHKGSRKGTRVANGNTLWATKDPESINYPREYSVVPKYPTDLNAMHEAEKVLMHGNWKAVQHAANHYISELYKILGCLDTATFQLVHASAAPRAEAFLRTLNLWTDA